MIVTGQGARGFLECGAGRFACALGRAGIVPASRKREGDGATPAGRWALRPGFYRQDRLALPDDLRHPFSPIAADMVWDDDPASAHYNRLVRAGRPDHPERLLRADGVYDVIVPLGYNDDPPVAGLGSAIFLHVARDGYAPTAGCVALALPDLLTVLGDLAPGAALDIRAP